jgi:hypothetical protein
MFGDIIEIAIGVVLVYLLISLLCTAFTEGVSAIFGLRASFLEKGVKSLLSDPQGRGIFTQFVNHPLVQSLTPPREGTAKSSERAKRRLPSYMTSRVFSAALLDLTPAAELSSETGNALRNRINRLDETEARKCLKALFTTNKIERESWTAALPQGDFAADLRNLLPSNDPDAISRLIDSLHHDDALTALSNLITRQESTAVHEVVEQLPHGTFRLDVLAFLASGSVYQWIDRLDSPELKGSLNSLMKGVGADPGQIRKEIEQWFDESMQRVSGWYKRRTQVIVMAFALPLIIALNADTLTVANSLLQSGALRDAAGELGSQIVADTDTPNEQAVDDVRDGLSELNLLGWRARSDDYQDPREAPDFGNPQSLLIKMAGMALTWAAVYQGSDFWFNALKKLVNIRSSGDPPPPQPSSPAARGS